LKIDVILDARAKAQELAELGQLAERCGINGVWVSSLLDSRDPFANLALLAQTTSRIHLGPIAVNPFDTHPVKIASALLTLNEMASGRARIVIGGGGEALQALDIRPERRVRAVRECVEIIRAAASGERVSYAGELFRVSNLQLRWLESAAPAIYVGASQQQMLSMAARCADGIMMSDMPPQPAARAIATLDTALKIHGRQRPEFATNVFTAWHVYQDRDHALREARRWLLLRGIFRPWLLAEFLDPDDVALVMASEAAFAKAFAAGSHLVEGVPDRVLDKMVEKLTVSGSLDDLDPMIDKLRSLRDAGLGSVALRLYADPAASIRLIGERVVPEVC
jgi:5,10-methylenetetrahydromethanopterin reductase